MNPQTGTYNVQIVAFEGGILPVTTAYPVAHYIVNGFPYSGWGLATVRKPAAERGNKRDDWVKPNQITLGILAQCSALGMGLAGRDERHHTRRRATAITPRRTTKTRWWR